MARLSQSNAVLEWMDLEYWRVTTFPMVPMARALPLMIPTTVNQCNSSNHSNNNPTNTTNNLNNSSTTTMSSQPRLQLPTSTPLSTQMTPHTETSDTTPMLPVTRAQVRPPTPGPVLPAFPTVLTVLEPILSSIPMILVTNLAMLLHNNLLPDQSNNNNSRTSTLTTTITTTTNQSLNKLDQTFSLLAN